MASISKRKSLWIGWFLLLLLAVLWWPDEGIPDDETRSNDSSSGRESSVKGQGGQESGRPTRSTRRVTSVARKPTHHEDDLRSFYHPAIVLEDETLEGGLRLLLESYREICTETGETALPLRWEVRGSPQVIRRLTLQGDFLNSCRLLAFASRMKFEVLEGELVFSELETGPMQAGKWEIPPTFHHHIAELGGKWSSAPENGSTDPFTGGPPAGFSVQGEAKTPVLSEILRSMGVLQEGEEVVLLTGSGQLVVNAGPGTSELIESLVSMASTPPVQIKYEVRHQVGDEWLALPKVVAIPGQSATVEMGREYVGLRGDEVVTAWVGVKLEMAGELYGFGERTTVTYQRTDPPSDRDLATFQQSGRLEDLNLETVRLDDRQVVKTIEDRREDRRLDLTPEEVTGGTGLGLRSVRINALGEDLEGP